MKRKIITSFLSVLLATLMLFSLFQIVPFRVLGESGSVSAHSVKIDFDSENSRIITVIVQAISTVRNG